MADIKGITINFKPTPKTARKLHAIAKHAEALANELDAIDNEWACSNCGHDTYSSFYANDTLQYKQCERCHTNIDE